MMNLGAGTTQTQNEPLPPIASRTRLRAQAQPRTRTDAHTQTDAQTHAHTRAHRRTHRPTGARTTRTRTLAQAHTRTRSRRAHRRSQAHPHALAPGCLPRDERAQPAVCGSCLFCRAWLTWSGPALLPHHLENQNVPCWRWPARNETTTFREWSPGAQIDASTLTARRIYLAEQAREKQAGRESDEPDER